MTLHLANANLEDDLQNPKPLPESLQVHRNYLQLQFLPLLYTDEPILVTEKPSIKGNFVLYTDHGTYNKLDVWSATPATAIIAAHFGANNPSQPLELLQKITSKTFICSPEKLLNTPEELQDWLENAPYPKVLKTPFGHSGRGHQVFTKPGKSRFSTFPLIGEPWEARKRDFSTQWHLGKAIMLLGHCHNQNTPYGAFHQAVTGQKEPLLDAHLAQAEPLVQKVHKLGYRGHLGVDAFVADTLHPLVEINPRKTMGWLALEVAKKRKKPITLTCGIMLEGLLPPRKKALNIHIAEN
jgi:hypothetical protein